MTKPTVEILENVYSDVLKAWSGAHIDGKMNPERASRVTEVWASNDPAQIGSLISEITGSPFASGFFDGELGGKLGELSEILIKAFCLEVYSPGQSPRTLFDSLVLWIKTGHVSRPSSELGQLSGFIESQYEDAEGALSSRIALAAPHVPAIACIHCCIQSARSPNAAFVDVTSKV